MKRLTCVLALLLICVTAAGATDKAKALYKQGWRPRPGSIT